MTELVFFSFSSRHPCSSDTDNTGLGGSTSLSEGHCTQGCLTTPKALAGTCASPVQRGLLRPVHCCHQSHHHHFSQEVQLVRILDD